MSVAEGKMVELARTCSKLQEKIEVQRARIAELKNERLCSCGNVVALDANFCPKCGSKLEELTTSRKIPSPPVFVKTVDEDEEDEDQYYGADELTDEEKEIAMKLHPQSVVYSEILPSEDDEPPLRNMRRTNMTLNGIADMLISWNGKDKDSLSWIVASAIGTRMNIRTSPQSPRTVVFVI